MMEDHPYFNQDELEEAYLNSFPVGYKFSPTDSELIEGYLAKKNANQRLPVNKIEDVDLYSFNPWELTEKHKSYGKKECYYFTSRDRKYPNGNRPNRKANDGFWKAVGKAFTIDNDNGTRNKIGSKRTLVFHLGDAKDHKKTNWIMHEYILVDDNDSSFSPSSSKIRISTTDKNYMMDLPMEGWGLCKIYHNHKQDKLEQKNVLQGVRGSEMEVKVKLEEKMPNRTLSSIHHSSSSSITNVVHEDKKPPLMISSIAFDQQTTTLSTNNNNNPFELSQQPYDEVLQLFNEMEMPDMTFLTNDNNDNKELLTGGQNAAALDATMAIDPNLWWY